MTRILEYVIDSKASGLTVQEYLKTLGCSRNVISRLKAADRGIAVNGEPVFSSRRLSAGERLTLTLREETSSCRFSSPAPEPVFPEPDIVYEDEDLAVVSKPAGVPVHPSQGNHGNTLADILAWHYRQKGQPFLYRAVSRLDRDTTGLMIVAKNMFSASILSSMAATRQIRREYLAIALGRTDEAGVIDAPIGRKEGSIIERTVDAAGERAVTHYERILYRPDLDASLVKLRLETGRTHQIRVHMAYIGHPLPGDFLYCPDYSLINRQALHSHSLTFLHPVTKKELHFEAPLPDDMQFILPEAVSRHS